MTVEIALENALISDPKKSSWRFQGIGATPKPKKNIQQTMNTY